MRGRGRGRKDKRGQVEGGPGANTKRCAIYTRTSTTQGLDQAFNSLDAQREACESFVRVHASEGWTAIPERFDDGGASGGDTDRDGFQRLLAWVDAGRVDIVVVYKFERISRSQKDFQEILERLRKAGCGFVSATQHISTENAMGRLMLNVLMDFAQFERENGAERTRHKIHASRRRGLWTGGVPPLGYKVEKTELVPDEAWRPLALDVIKMWLETRSLTRTVQRLNSNGLLRPVRRKGGTVAGMREWTTPDVMRLVSSVHYGGFVPLGDEMFPGAHEALIDKDTFDKLRRSVNSLGTCPPAAVRNTGFLLSGRLRCGACGLAMTGASARNRHGTVYRYYRCTRRDKGGPGACPTRPLAAAAAEAYVVFQVRDRLCIPGMPARLAAAAEARIATKQVGLEEERRALRARKEKGELDRRRAAATYVGAEGAARAAVQERLAELELELEETELRIHQLNSALEAAEMARSEIAAMGEVFSDFDRSWDLLSTENQRRLLHGIIDTIETQGPGAPLMVRLVEAANDDERPGRLSAGV